MPFNSLTFALFLPVVFAGYWLAARGGARAQNLLLIAASAVFYAWWDWRFLLLIGLNTVADFAVGLQLGRTEAPRRRRALLAVSVGLNLGLLCFFKYFNFFLAGLSAALTGLGVPLRAGTVVVLLPVAISFYTLQTMTYSIDVYNRRLEPTRDFAAFAAYILFFPKLLAGPIERATTCLPQFLTSRTFDPARARDGLRQILWGLAKKMVIADGCAVVVDRIFGGYATFSGSTLLLGAVLFAAQIYADFSGYSDIAIGVGRLFGVHLMRNFAYPYFARSVADFWRRWHISLSSWLRDYLFLPVSYALSRRLDRDRYAGIRVDRVINVVATLVTFLLCGLWHGANLTYVAWGLLFGLYLVPQFFRRRARAPAGTAVRPAIRAAGQMVATFLLVVVAWVFFRADSIQQAFGYLAGMAGPSLLTYPQLVPFGVLVPTGILAAVEWVQRDRQHGLDFTDRAIPRPARWLIYGALVVAIIASPRAEQPFIYFRF